MPTLTEQLIDKVLAVHYDMLPTAAIDMAKQVTLDGIAVTA
jgi:2-methylcitrate dehydratase PrpD